MNMPSRTHHARRSLLAAALAVLASPPVSSQTPDTTAAWRYLPLAVGNEWHTSTSTYNGYWTEYTQTREVVQSEQPEAPGYFAVQWTRRHQQFPSSPVVTSAGTAVWGYNAATQRVDGADTPCPLGAPFGAPVTCGTRPYAVTGGHGQSVSIGSQNVTAARKQYVYYPNIPSGYYRVDYVFAAGIGATRHEESRHNGTDPNIVTRTLSYARVGGQEYGTPLTFPSAGEDDPMGSGLALTVGPNPTRGAVALRYTLPEAGVVRLTVTDVLGRTVAVVAEGVRVAGPHEAMLDARALAPGFYVVRLEVGGEATTRRVTIAR